MPILNLPEELLELIRMKLEKDELLPFGMTCRLFYRLAARDIALYRRFRTICCRPECHNKVRCEHQGMGLAPLL